MASETDAARARVLAARDGLATQLETLEASGRAAVDIPARIKQSPGKAAAAAGGIGFLALKGPQRLFGAARRAVRGERADFPESMLPDEVEKTLRKLGRDGDKVRGALERDFADYAKRSQKERDGLKTMLLMAAARPLLSRGAKVAGDILLTPDHGGFSQRLSEIRERAAAEAERRRGLAEDAAAAADAADAGDGTTPPAAGPDRPAR